MPVGRGPAILSDRVDDREGRVLKSVRERVAHPAAYGSLRAMRLESVGRLLVAGLPVAVGLFAWRGVPFGRLGVLLVLSGVVWLVVTFSLADTALVYSIGRVADWVGWAALVSAKRPAPPRLWFEPELVALADEPRIVSPRLPSLAPDLCWVSAPKTRWSDSNRARASVGDTPAKRGLICSVVE